MAGNGRTAFAHSAEVHYVLPTGGEWAFNAWSPKVIGNHDYVPMCHYSGPMAVKRKARELGLGELSRDEAGAVLAIVRTELRHRNTTLSDHLFSQLVKQALG
jgi:isopropylmalate/homocitrate/citramalate synthase